MFALCDCNCFYCCASGVPAEAAGQARGRAVQQRRVRDRSHPRSQGAGHPDGRAGVPVAGAIQEHSVEVFSSNYALYGDMSRRVMHVLATARWGGRGLQHRRGVPEP